MHTSESTHVGAVVVSSNREDVWVGGGGKSKPECQQLVELAEEVRRLTRVLELVVDVHEEAQFSFWLERHRPLLEILDRHLLDFRACQLSISQYPPCRLIAGSQAI